MSVGQSCSLSGGFNIQESYNSRLQPNEIQASSAAGSAIDITYSFVDPSGGNAGHVNSINNNLNSGRSQTFTYDQVNRISSAATSSATAANCWGYSYGYDGAWGNLTGMLGASGYGACSGTVMSASANGNNQLTGFTYDAAGNTLDDGNIHNYIWDGESQLASANGVGYSYDGDGRRVAKVGSKFYWYGSGGEILAETDGSGNTLNEYVFFGGRRVSVLPSTGGPLYYGSDMLGTSRVMVQSDGTLCYDADFTPFGEERPYTSNCSQNYKFEGKERDTETGNDEFGARYYSWRFGRWLSSDWSSVPTPVPYANLTNPQTLNLYSMVSDDPESFADLDGHTDDTPVQSGTYSGSTPVVPTDNSNNSSETSQQGKLQAQQNKPQVDSNGNPTFKPPAPGLPAGVATVKYINGAPALSKKVEDKLIKEAGAPGVLTLSVGFTTNGKHAANSNHYAGTAADIDFVNGMPATQREYDRNSVATQTIDQLVDHANNSGAHEVFAPGAQIYKNGDPFTASTPAKQQELIQLHTTHIHVAVGGDDQ